MLAGVVLAHALIFALLLQLTSTKLTPLAPTVLSVSMLAPEPQPTPQATVQTQPTPSKPVVAKQAAPTPRQLLTQETTTVATTAAPTPEPLSTTSVVAAPAAPSSAAASHNNAPALPISQPTFDADYLDNPKPIYPLISRRMREEGRVLLRVKVSANGLATEVDLHTSSGSPRLDQAAIVTVQRWKFVPARRGSEAIAATVLVPIAFSLKD